MFMQCRYGGFIKSFCAVVTKTVYLFLAKWDIDIFSHIVRRADGVWKP